MTQFNQIMVGDVFILDDIFSEYGLRFIVTYTNSQEIHVVFSDGRTGNVDLKDWNLKKYFFRLKLRSHKQVEVRGRCQKIPKTPKTPIIDMSTDELIEWAKGND